MRNTYKIVVKVYEGKRHLERPRNGCEINVRMNLEGTG
jgi:hypothetical protein